MALEEIIKDLNPQQQQAVTYGDGPFLIIAGAGTGKTTVITRRIAWLILSGLAKPEEVLALTFTDKAAQEMEERVDKLLPYGYVDLWVSTFHSFCERILRQHAIDIGLPLNFKIFNSTQQALLVRRNFDRFNLDYYRPLGNPFKFIQDLLKHFSRAKDESISPEDYLAYAEKIALNQDSAMSHELLDQESARLKEVAEAYHTYQQILLENSALDFGDLINYTMKLFKERPNILAQYRQQFKYVLVDEFQDTNWAQYELLKMLGAPKNNLTVVADDDQSIYKFRGASYNNVIQFKRDYPATNEVVLVKNYRSKQEILDLAYNFIQLNNPNRLEAQISADETADLPANRICKKLDAWRGSGATIELLRHNSSDEEARDVADKIIALKEKNSDLNWSDFAILVRANNQAEIFCQALRWRGVPYQFLASSGLFSKPIILDILAYLKLLINYHESPAVYRILTSPIFNLKLSNEDLVNINYWANRKGRSLYQTLKNINTISGLAPVAIEAVNQLLGWIEKHSQMARKESASRIIFAFLEDSGYLKFISQLAEKGGVDNIETIAWVSQFFKKVEEFENTYADKSLKNFLDTMQIIIDSGDEGSLATDIVDLGPETVKIMTVHGAKGLEFKQVFVVNLVDRRFPTNERQEGIALPDALVKEIIPGGDIHLQEERRLFYVALTRARDGLYLTLANDYGGTRAKKPSRFLSELGLLKKDEMMTVKTRAPRLPIFEAASSEKLIAKPQLPAKLSFSQLRAFANCPLQYKFAFILRIPVRGRYVYSFGQSMHLTLYNFLLKYKEQAQLAQGGLFSANESACSRALPSEEDLLKIYRESWLDDWYPDDKIREEYRQKGEKSLRRFYQEFAASPPKIKGLEFDFNFKVGPCTTKGKIDRVDDLGDGIELIDYKTGQPKDNKGHSAMEQGSALTEKLTSDVSANAAVKPCVSSSLGGSVKTSFSTSPLARQNKLSGEDKEQLLIYQMAAQELFKEPIKKLTYYYLDDNSRVSFLGDKSDLEQMKQKIMNGFQEIQDSVFPPRPSLLCRHCDFKDICEYRKL